MKMPIALSLAALLAASASPAYAWNGYYGGQRYDYNRYDNRYDHRDYYAPVNRVGYGQPSYYQPAIASNSVSCGNSFNPITGVLGGAVGGIAGNGIGKGNGRTAAIITGAVLGTAFGGAAGGARCTEQVVYQSPPIVQTAYVQRASAQDYYGNDRNDGRYCREYQNRSTVGGRVQETYGTACMQPDGSWEIVD